MRTGIIEEGTAAVIVGGQFGSEAKGLAAGIVRRQSDYTGRMICTTNAGAQAGHTTVMEDGRKFICYHLPTLGMLYPLSTIYLNAGSIIDPILLGREIAEIAKVLDIDSNSIWDRLNIHPSAAVITDEARAAEGVHSTGKNGSTMKGVGAALCNKIMRKPGSVVAESDLSMLSCMMNLNDKMKDGWPVTVEIPQGTGLSINGGMWPSCTSRECWLGQGLTDAGIHPSFLGQTAMVVRTCPIRVGNIYGPSAPGLRDYVELGNSGPFYPDSHEMEWTDLPGIEPERTTVTKRIRRIATFSEIQYDAALQLNRPNKTILTFTNYMTPAGLNEIVLAMRRVERNNNIWCGHIYSWGPKASQCSPHLADCYEHCRHD